MHSNLCDAALHTCPCCNSAVCQYVTPAAPPNPTHTPHPPATSPQVTQLPGERSYHVFYQLVAGASEEERSAYHLPCDAADFKYLSRSGCLVRAMVLLRCLPACPPACAAAHCNVVAAMPVARGCGRSLPAAAGAARPHVHNEAVLLLLAAWPHTLLTPTMACPQHLTTNA